MDKGHNLVQGGLKMSAEWMILLGHILCGIKGNGHTPKRKA
jgi:hypothetical protein